MRHTQFLRILTIGAAACLGAVALAQPATGEVDDIRTRLRALIDNPDQFVPGADERGALPYTLDWSIETKALEPIEVIDSAINLEGTIFIALQQGIAEPLDYSVRAYDATATNQSDAPETPSLDFQIEPAGTEVTAIAVDLEGAVYIATKDESLAQAWVSKYPPGRETNQWVAPVPGGGSQSDGVQSLLITPDGAVIAAGRSHAGPYVYRIEPFFGGTEWAWTGASGFVRSPVVDAQSDVFFGFDSDGRTVLYKLDGQSGVPLFDSPPQVAEGGGEGFPLRDAAVDQQGNVVTLASPDISVPMPARIEVREFDPAGNELWSYTQSTPPVGTEMRADSIVFDRNGDYLVGFVSGRPQRAVVMKIAGDGSSPNDAPLWITTQPFPSNPGFNDAAGLTLLSVGAFKGVYAYGSGGGHPWIARLDEEDGSIDWQYDNDGETSFLLTSQDLLEVDAGGNVYAAEYFVPGNGDELSGFRKISQPTPDDPTIQTANPNLTIEDQSIWAPGVNQVSIGDSFGFPFPLDLGFGFGGGGCFNTFLFGEFGGGINFDLDLEFDLGYAAEASGGSVDIHLPLDIAWTIPAPNDIGVDPKNPDAPIIVQIDTEFEIDDAARMTTCFTPYYNAGLTGALEAGLDFSISAKAFSQTLFDENLIDESATFESQYIPFLNVQHIFSELGYPPDGDWITQTYIWGNITARYPQITAQAALENGQMQTGDIRDNFYRTRSNLTQLLMDVAYPGVSPLNQQGEFCEYGVNGAWDYGALQFILGLDLEAIQNFGLTNITPKVRYEIRDNAGDTEFTTVIQDLADPLIFELFEDADAHVTPFVFAEAQFRNETSLALVPKLILEVLSFVASFGFGDWSLFDIDECFFCDEISLGDLFNFELYAADFQVSFPEIEVAPLIVTGATSGGPEIVGASRSKLDMFIYDQTAPTVGSFNVISSRKSRSLIYGSGFEPGGNSNTTKAMITHLGRTEELEAEVLNDATILVDIPNRFRLLPGVARLQVTTGLGTSRMLDLPVCYPTPRLDTVNPNIWAADPELNTIPIQVIDRNNPLGNNTFIARRDYYILMRDQLWSNITAGGLTAEEYFPCFDFDALPAIPSILFGGKPLPRYVQPIENGILNARLAPYNFDRPRIVDVTLCTPGPGGGMSETRQLHVAAPRPVAAILDPPEIEPGGELLPGETGVEIRVLGPRHVPTWDGFEEPKFGNFNADSVVMFDGLPLETQFYGSGELRAIIPPGLVQHPRRVFVSVYTPDNGTEYLERLVDGSGEVVSFDLVPSGGESAPIAFDVRFRQPEIENLMPDTVAALSPAFEARPVGQDQNNLRVMGKNFRDGAVVLVDGMPRQTEFVGRNLIKAQLLPSDVAVPGVRRISVLNPGSEGDVSPMMDLTIMPAMNPRYTSRP